MTKEDLQEVLRLHKKWLCGEMGGIRAALRNADLSGADLSNASLCGADLYRTDLSGADLRHANLSCADLSYADLSGADLSRADLAKANMRYADMTNADLSYADLSGVNMSHADMIDADMSGACLADGPNVNCLRGQPVYQVAGVGKLRRALTLHARGERSDWRWFAGCFYGTEAELRAAVADKYPPLSAGYEGYMLAIDYLAAMAGLNADMDQNTNPNNTTQQ